MKDAGFLKVIMKSTKVQTLGTISPSACTFHTLGEHTGMKTEEAIRLCYSSSCID